MNLETLGIKEPLDIIGNYRILHIEKNAPIVFLLDEHHGNKNNCIDKNIENAKELIDKVNVTIIGVESLAGGIEWDIDKEGYVKNDDNIKYYNFIKSNWKSNKTKFADKIITQHNEKVYGVESIGMMDKIEVDLYKKLYNDVTEHPLNLNRSKHHIITLFKKRNELGLEGNLILNCGKNHNSDIEEFIKNSEIEEIVGFKASYIRLNAFD